MFDIKIDLVHPSKSDLSLLHNSLSGNIKHKFKEDYIKNKTKFSMPDLEEILNRKIDTYLFYYLTDNCENNLMWGHYASSHKGFCIEWDANEIKATKVQYKEDIASIALLDIIKLQLNMISEDEMQTSIIQAFITKLTEWEYESEYRFQLSNKKYNSINERFDNFALVRYEPKWIKAIIWGCRTTDKVKNHIKAILPENMVYKQAKIGRSKVYVE